MTTEYITTTIPASNTKSGIVHVKNGIPTGIYTDPSMSSTSFTFLAGSSLNSCMSNLNDGSTGASYTVTFTAGDYVPLNPSIMAGVTHFIIIGNSSEATFRNLNVTAVY